APKAKHEKQEQERCTLVSPSLSKCLDAVLPEDLVIFPLIVFVRPVTWCTSVGDANAPF
ncbi:hypothetical protein ACH5RR_036708, partial [Cinchona calisaya]